MKLRIRGNSIRLRLGQSEVRCVAREGEVEDSTSFGLGTNQCFHYSLYASADELAVNATFTGRRIVVRVPWDVMNRWATTDQVSIHAIQRVNSGELRILIEKDFRCTDAPGYESQEDAFTNPQFETPCLAVNLD